MPNYFSLANIHFFVDQIKYSLSQKRLTRQWIINAIVNEKKITGEINYIFCSDEYLLNINKTYLNHTTLTDIITFPTEPAESLNSKTALKSTINGEIYISIERVKENAKKFNSGFNKELRRVMIHGVLHLCGYGDKTDAEEKKMRKKEDYYLNLF